MHARERLYLTADKQSLVGEGSPKAAFLYAAPGDEIPTSAAERFGLVDGRLKAKATGTAADAPPSKKPAPAKAEKKPAPTKEQTSGADKERKSSEDKDSGGGQSST